METALEQYLNSTCQCPTHELEYEILKPEMFGAVGDGVTDDTNALVECLDTAREENKPVLLTETYLTNSTLNVADIVLISENARIIADTNNAYVLQAVGTRSDYIRIAENSVVERYGTQVRLSSAAAVASLNLKSGDLIKIREMGKVFDSSLPITRGGEIQRVHSVAGDTINIDGSFEQAYDGIAVNQTEVCKINPVYFENFGLLTIVQGGQVNSMGFLVDWGDKPRVNMRFINCIERSLYIKDCYAPIVNIESENSTNTATGYGLAIGNSTMYGKFTGLVNGARHSVAIGGDGAERGVSWRNIVHDFIAVSGLTLAIYDCHAGVGSVIFERCTARGLTNRHGVSLSPIGFQLNCYNYTIKDCIAENCENAVNIIKTGRTYENVVIDGLTCKQIRRHVITLQGSANFDNLIIRNITSDSDTFYNTTGSSNVAINILPSSAISINRFVLENIIVKNHQCAIAIFTTVTIPNGLTINNVKHSYTVTPVNALNDYNNTIRIENNTGLNLYLKNVESENVALFRAHFNTSLPNLVIDSCKVNNASSSYIWTGEAVTNLKIINSEFAGNVPTIEYYFVRGKNITNLLVSNVTLSGTTLRGIIVFSGTITNFQENNNILVGTFQTSTRSILAGISPTNWILNGSIANPYIIRGASAPEGLVVASQGALYTRTTGELYLKVTGTGNTGWVLK
jgi:hypothetical protein